MLRTQVRLDARVRLPQGKDRRTFTGSVKSSMKEALKAARTPPPLTPPPLPSPLSPLPRGEGRGERESG